MASRSGLRERRTIQGSLALQVQPTMPSHGLVGADVGASPEGPRLPVDVVV
jgi:hypothetical protein